MNSATINLRSNKNGIKVENGGNTEKDRLKWLCEQVRWDMSDDVMVALQFGDFV